MKNKNQTEEKRNKNLRDYHKRNPSLSITKLARIFHLSNTRINQILKSVKVNNNNKQLTK